MIGFDVQDVIVAWGFDEVMFLSCFSVKISENSETLKTEELCEELCNWMHWKAADMMRNDECIKCK